MICEFKPNQTVIMGILNVTPDSFSDGGKFIDPSHALRQVEAMLHDGADIIDIGGESTRPGALDVAVDEELARVIPVIEAIKKHFDCPISLDTSKAQVMAAGIAAGVDLINDVAALTGEGCLDVVASSNLPVCLMHMQGRPRTMQQAPIYKDVIQDIYDFFEQRIEACQRAGISQSRIVLDPGFGFGKTLADNYTLLNNLDKFNSLNSPLLIGVSRKSMIGQLLDLDVEQRMVGSVVAATLALTKGARWLRVHDVKETKQAVRIVNAMQNGVFNE